jgi:MFS family permease
VAAVLVFTFAEILQGPTINSLVVDLAPADAPGRHLAAFQLSWSLGQAAAPALLTWLLSRGAALPWLALVAVCVLAAAAVSGLRGQPRLVLQGEILFEGVAIAGRGHAWRSPAPCKPQRVRSRPRDAYRAGQAPNNTTEISSE